MDIERRRWYQEQREIAECELELPDWRASVPEASDAELLEVIRMTRRMASSGESYAVAMEAGANPFRP
jgi:hypothetical protein